MDGRTKTNQAGKKAFPTQAEAEAYADSCRIKRANEGIAAFTPNAELAKHGESTDAAVKFYLAHLRSLENSKPVSDVIAAFKLEKAGKSNRYTGDLKNRLAKFEEQFGKQMIAAIPTDELNEWLQGLPVSVVTRNTYRRRLSPLFAFAKQKKWIPANPFAGGKKSEVPRADEPRKKVRTLTNDQVSRLLEVATDQTLPFWCIAIFAGLRPESELGRLRWEDIDLEEKILVVDGDASETMETKTGRRVVKLADNLVQWLQPYAGRTGNVMPGLTNNNGSGWKWLRIDKRKVGFGTPGTETPEERAAGVKLTRWAEDLTRHTFGSHYLAQCGDVGQTATIMGNSILMVKTRYLALKKPAETAQFWSIAPATSDKVVQIGKAA